MLRGQQTQCSGPKLIYKCSIHWHPRELDFVNPQVCHTDSNQSCLIIKLFKSFWKHHWYDKIERNEHRKDKKIQTPAFFSAFIF